MSNRTHGASYSLKGGKIPSREVSACLDTIEDLQNGKSGAAERLSKYVDSHLISLETYNELIEKYGAIKEGEKGAESRSAKLVKLEAISFAEYEELLRKYGSIRVENYGTLHHLNAVKRERVLRKMKNIFIFVLAACVLLSSFALALGELVIRHGKGVAFLSFFLWLWSFSYLVDNSFTSKQISELERENERLKTSLEFYNDINRKLESKLENTNDHPQE